MRQKPHLRLLMAGLAVIMTAVIGVYAHSSLAVARATVYTKDGTDQCYGVTVPATYQDSKIGISLLYFESTDAVYVDVTFPDGSVFTQPVAFTNPASVGFNPDLALDGVINQPINAPSVAGPIIGGQGFVALDVPKTFPYGCYKVAARSSTHNAYATFAVKPRIDPPPFNGTAQLRIEDRTTGALVVQHGGAVNILGQGFPANTQIYVWITAPDGTVLSWPEQFSDPSLMSQLQTNNDGRFVASFEFANYNPVGEYKFTAQSATKNLNGVGSQPAYTVIAPITLVAQPIQQQGWATIRASFPADQGDVQRRPFQIQGERFTPGEIVTLWVNFPDGSVRGLPSQYADEIGTFYITLGTDEVLPTGEYKVTANGLSSGSLVITSFQLEQVFGVNPITTDPYDPNIVDSSSFGPVVQQPVWNPCSNDEVSLTPPDSLDPIDVAGNPGPEVSGRNYSCP